MEDSTRKFGLFGVIGLLFLLVVGVLIFFWGTRRNNEVPVTTGEPAATGSPIENIEDESLVSYTIPNGWIAERCESYPGIIYLLPPDTATFDCTGSRSAPIVIYKDAQNTTSCDQLANQTGAANHACSDITIDDHQAVSSTTTYQGSPDYPDGTTVSTYFIKTNKGPVAIRYVYTGPGTYRSVFTTLVESSTIKN